MGYANGMPPEQKSKKGLWIGLGCGCFLLLLLIVGTALAFFLLSGMDEKASEPKDAATTSTAAPAPAPNPGGSAGGGDQPNPAPKPGASDGGGDQPKPNPAPNPVPGPGAQPAPGQGDPDPAPGTGTGGAGGNTLPDQVGEFKVDSTLPPMKFGDVSQVYSAPDGSKTFWVEVFNDPANADMWISTIETNGQQLGNWKCEPDTYGETGGSCFAQGPGGSIIFITSSGTKDLKEIASFGDQLTSDPSGRPE